MQSGAPYEPLAAGYRPILRSLDSTNLTIASQAPDLARILLYWSYYCIFLYIVTLLKPIAWRT